MRLSTLCTTTSASAFILAAIGSIGVHAAPYVPTLEPIFHLTIYLDTPTAPIGVSGGVELIYPITGGVLTGSVNGTITGGSNLVKIPNVGPLELATVRVWGLLEDQYAWIGEVSSIVNPQGGEFEADRISVAEGPYSYLSDYFIACSFYSLTATQGDAECFTPKGLAALDLS